MEKLIVDIKVYDLNRAINFYQNVIGLPLIHKEDYWASFEAFGAEIHLYIHGGINSNVEFMVSDIKEEVKNLKNKGVKFFVDKNQPNIIRIVFGEIMIFPWGKIAFFRDSENNQLALVEDKKA